MSEQRESGCQSSLSFSAAVKQLHGKPSQMKTRHLSRATREQTKQEFVACIYEALLADGHIDIKGKNEEQIMGEVLKSALRWSKLRPMMMSIDFKGDLLTRARSFKRSGKEHEAILYYATWFEHWINGILLRGLRSLDERERCQMIRDVGLRGKFSWMPAFIHGKRFPQKHINAVLKICDLRNEFVHYKYKMVDADDDSDESRFKEAHKMAESAIRYFLKFEERHFFKGAARGVLRNLRNMKQRRNGSTRLSPKPLKMG
jgi:hypothetical protein